MKPLVSVIILNWNRKSDVSEMLKRIRPQTFKDFEVIVVDNASEDGSVAHFKKYYPDVRIVELDKNYGLYGFNFGMKQAKGDYFLLLASDAIPKRNLIKKHVEKLKMNPRLGVSCASTYEWESKKSQGPNRAIEGDNKRGYEVTYFDGNGICLRRSVFEKVGGYSQDYFICLEELDWAAKILEAGFDIRCFTDIVVYNKRAQEGGSYRSKLGYYYCRNWIWFYIQFLPWREMPNFLILHLKSFLKKTEKGGNMKKLDCIKGIFASFGLLPKFLLQRKTVSQVTLERIKADIFPNPMHLYIE